MLKQVSLASMLLALAAAAPQYPLYHPFPVYSPYMTVPLVRSPVSPSVYPSQYVNPYPYFYPYSYAPAPPAPVQPQHQPPVTHTRVTGFAKPVDDALDDYLDNDDISLKLAEKLLTPQQLRQLEETVAAMNPLEYAARLEITKDPVEALRLFKKSHY